MIRRRVLSITGKRTLMFINRIIIINANNWLNKSMKSVKTWIILRKINIHKIKTQTYLHFKNKSKTLNVIVTKFKTFKYTQRKRSWHFYSYKTKNRAIGKTAIISNLKKSKIFDKWSEFKSMATQQAVGSTISSTSHRTWNTVKFWARAQEKRAAIESKTFQLTEINLLALKILRISPKTSMIDHLTNSSNLNIWQCTIHQRATISIKISWVKNLILSNENTLTPKRHKTHTQSTRSEIHSIKAHKTCFQTIHRT